MIEEKEIRNCITSSTESVKKRLNQLLIIKENSLRIHSWEDSRSTITILPTLLIRIKWWRKLITVTLTIIIIATTVAHFLLISGLKDNRVIKTLQR